MEEKKKIKIYLASPYGFAESTMEFMGKIVNILESNGYEVKNPWDFVSDEEFKNIEEIKDAERRREELKKIDMKLAKMNEEAIRNSDMVFAILDGVDVDSGTASEIGLAYALGKKIYGYRGDFRQSGENEGVRVNLQLQYWIEESGGEIFQKIDEIKKDL